MRKRSTPVLVDYLGHIAQAIDRVERYTADVDHAAFRANEEKQDAVIRNFEIIGEASANIARQYPDFIATHPTFRWQDAYGMRNVLAHGYFKVDLDLVWKTVGADLSALKARVNAMLAELADNDTDLS